MPRSEIKNNERYHPELVHSGDLFSSDFSNVKVFSEPDYYSSVVDELKTGDMGLVINDFHKEKVMWIKIITQQGIIGWIDCRKVRKQI